MIARDTSPEIDEIQIGLLRKAGPARRLQLAEQLSAMVWKASRHAVDRYYPQENADQRDERFLAGIYGSDLAERFIAHRQKIQGPRNKGADMTDEIVAVTLRVVEVLESLNVAYEIGGSLATSMHGTPRSTVSVEFAVDFRPGQAAVFVNMLENEFFTNERDIEEAIQKRMCCSIIHAATLRKINLATVDNSEFEKISFSRRVRVQLADDSGRSIYVRSAEDVVLHSLIWHAQSGEVLTQAYQDAFAVLRVSGASMDSEYLHRWAIREDVHYLLKRLE